MRGQRRYVIRRIEGERELFWRRAGNQHQGPEWTYDLSRATAYRSSSGAMFAVLKLDRPPSGICVCELILATGKTVFRNGD